MKCPKCKDDVDFTFVVKSEGTGEKLPDGMREGRWSVDKFDDELEAVICPNCDENVMDLIHGKELHLEWDWKEDVWSDKWPTKPGHYWFYGWPFGKSGDLQVKLMSAEAYKGGNAIMVVAEGAFLYRSQAHGMFAPAYVPREPRDF